MNIILAKSLSVVSLIAASGAAYAANTGILSAMPDSSQSLADAIGQTAEATESGQAPAPAIPNEVTESASSNPFQAFIEVFTGDDDNESAAGREVDWDAVAPSRSPQTPTTAPVTDRTETNEPAPTPSASASASETESGTAVSPSRPSSSGSDSHSGGSASSSTSNNNSDTTSGGSASYEEEDEHDGDDDHDEDEDHDDDEDEDGDDDDD